MNKSIYCVYWRWFDENGNELPRKCVTHGWYQSYRKAKTEFDKQAMNLYANYPERTVRSASPRIGWSVDDGSYELEAVRIYAHTNEESHIRLVLAATDLK